MGKPSSDFILDEGLDDDEDVLAFHSNRPRTSHGVYTPPPPPTDTLLLELPLTATRADVNSILCSSPIVSLQLRRLPHLLRARVKLERSSDATHALQSSPQLHGEMVRIEPFSFVRWDEGYETAVSVAQPLQNDLQNGVAESFWAAMGKAKEAAEGWEKKVREVGEDFEKRYKVGEKVEQVGRIVREKERELGVGEMMGEMGRVGGKVVGELDEKLGVSKGVGKVGQVVSIVAREVDESWRVSERVGGWGNGVGVGGGGGRYRPRAVEGE